MGMKLSSVFSDLSSLFFCLFVFVLFCFLSLVVKKEKHENSRNNAPFSSSARTLHLARLQERTGSCCVLGGWSSRLHHHKKEGVPRTSKCLSLQRVKSNYLKPKYQQKEKASEWINKMNSNKLLLLIQQFCVFSKFSWIHLSLTYMDCLYFSSLLHQGTLSNTNFRTLPCLLLLSLMLCNLFCSLTLLIVFSLQLVVAATILSIPLEKTKLNYIAKL